jgi:hypothetical protein
VALFIFYFNWLSIQVTEKVSNKICRSYSDAYLIPFTNLLYNGVVLEKSIQFEVLTVVKTSIYLEVHTASQPKRPVSKFVKV